MSDSDQSWNFEAVFYLGEQDPEYPIPLSAVTELGPEVDSVAQQASQFEDVTREGIQLRAVATEGNVLPTGAAVSWDLANARLRVTSPDRTNPVLVRHPLASPGFAEDNVNAFVDLVENDGRQLFDTAFPGWEFDAIASEPSPLQEILPADERPVAANPADFPRNHPQHQLPTDWRAEISTVSPGNTRTFAITDPSSSWPDLRAEALRILADSSTPDQAWELHLTIANHGGGIEMPYGTAIALAPDEGPYQADNRRWPAQVYTPLYPEMPIAVDGAQRAPIIQEVGLSIGNPASDSIGDILGRLYAVPDRFMAEIEPLSVCFNRAMREVPDTPTEPWLIHALISNLAVTIPPDRDWSGMVNAIRTAHEEGTASQQTFAQHTDQLTPMALVMTRTSAPGSDDAPIGTQVYLPIRDKNIGAAQLWFPHHPCAVGAPETPLNAPALRGSLAEAIAWAHQVVENAGIETAPADLPINGPTLRQLVGDREIELLRNPSPDPPAATSAAAHWRGPVHPGRPAWPTRHDDKYPGPMTGPTVL